MISSLNHSEVTRLLGLHERGHMLGAGSHAGSDTDISPQGIVQVARRCVCERTPGQHVELRLGSVVIAERGCI